MLNKLKYPSLVFFLSLVILFYFYHAVLLDPNGYLFASTGDGIKNYYAYLWHIEFDPSFWEFQGMNYPYGEHIVYADAHPLLSWIVRSLGLADSAIGILNLCMLLSYPICSVVLYKIFKHYKVSTLWSILAALAITFMSPQLPRITGHFSLAYVFAVPLMWYLLIKVNQGKKKYLWSIIIALYLLIFFFTHPYLGIILAFLSIFFYLVKMVRDRKDFRRVLTYAGLVFIQIAVPFLVFQGSIVLTDTHVDRPNNPAGFFHYYGSWKSILLAHSGPMNYPVHWLRIRLGNWESLSYIGFSTIVFGVITLVYVIRKRSEFVFKKLLRKELFLFFIAAWLILLFSFCFPFKFDFMRWLVDIFGPLKQFRVLGRFSWVFFYVSTVFVIVYFYRLKQKHKNPKLITAIFFAGIAFYFAEAYMPHHRISGLISQTKNEFKEEHLTDELKETVDVIRSENYDAIIVLPFTHLSSENIMMLGTEEANHDFCLLGYHTQTPVLNSITGRMSIREAIIFNNFFSPEFFEKELCNVIGYDKKIALVKNDQPLSFPQMQMIWASEKVFENEKYKVFDLDLKNWNTPYYFNEVVKKEQSAQVKNGSWRSDTSGVWFAYENFDEKTADYRFFGAGALQGEKTGTDVIYELDCNTLEDTLYKVSFWFYSGVDRPDVSAFVEEHYKDGSDAQWKGSELISLSNEIVDKWCRVELDFRVNDNLDKIKILLSGNGNGEPFIVDELLIRPAHHNLFARHNRNGEKFIVYNNHWLRSDSFRGE